MVKIIIFLLRNRDSGSILSLPRLISQFLRPILLDLLTNTIRYKIIINIT